MKKFLVVIIVFILILIISIITIIYAYRLFEVKTLENQVPLSLPQNNSAGNSIQSLQLKLPIATIQPGVSYSNDILDLNSKITSTAVGTTFLDKGHILLKSDNFNILIQNAGEGNPWSGNVTDDDKKVESHFSKDIYRVNDSDQTDTTTYLKNFGLNSKYVYFYTEMFNPGCFNQFPQTQYCGSQYITSPLDSKGNAHIFSVYCLVDDKQYLSQCDEFINNLEVSTENN